MMKANGLKSKTAKKYRPQTTDSNHNLPVAENVLNRQFTAEAPCQKWVSDITYISTDEGFLYLAGILDLYDRGIVGWSMQTHMKKELVMEIKKKRKKEKKKHRYRIATLKALLLVKAALVLGVHFSLDKVASGIIADIFLFKS